MVVMPTDNLILIGIRFFFDAVIENQHARRLLDFPDQRFDELPPTRRGLALRRQIARDLVMTDRMVKQLGLPGRRCITKRTE